ncbi:MAG TPA: phosphoribosylaminoimidazolesuccinocarboxamide synthase [Candidatus Thermoplasmatota archaeon]|nr:phosphoribosylaminoimidazolesuccinocarboxamide synthase [Candidatus Thermoplasmatota archaeon]
MADAAAGALLRTGKVKQVYDAGPGELEFVFTDNVSVFDKVIPTSIPRKGEVLNRVSEFWFRKIESALGVKTHFLSRPGPNRMRVRKVEVIDPATTYVGPGQRNYLLPLECICRFYAAGSLIDRAKQGQIELSRLGLGAPPKPGQKLPRPFVEFTTKLEKTDRPLTDLEAQRLAVMTDEEFYLLEDNVLKVNELINRTVEPRGLLHVDGKTEWAFDENRQLMLIDTVGTPDEDRFWDKAAYEAGQTIELSKELVRQHYRATGYHALLYEARAKGLTEPPIPPLPSEVAGQVSELYVRLHERITGTRL